MNDPREGSECERSSGGQRRLRWLSSGCWPPFHRRGRSHEMTHLPQELCDEERGMWNRKMRKEDVEWQDEEGGMWNSKKRNEEYIVYWNEECEMVS